ncbi:hypothetical protein [Rhodococcoides trifolii]|uniref:hypothetical protein n=1 Tax=Rhodococcoides trifolii TaxID=908250 RepID=UPI00166EB644|nr:hypothetical protein [Rhodococcus trifolii]
MSTAEADGCAVCDDWSVRAVGGQPKRAAIHAESIGSRLAELHRADRQAADAVVRALEPLSQSVGARNFLPLVIGVGLLVEMAVDALIAAGVVSLGALLFALVDQFGEGAWETIEDAIPDQFFADAGPVDQGSVEGVLDANSQPGRNSPNRQVGTDQDVKDLYETLAREGRSMDANRYPGVGVELPDGTQVRMRDSSTSGGATLDIKFPDGSKVVKVHVG